MNALTFRPLPTNTDTLTEVPKLLAEYVDTPYLIDSTTPVHTKAEAAHFLTSLSEYLCSIEIGLKHLRMFFDRMDYDEATYIELMIAGINSKGPVAMYQNLGDITDTIASDVNHHTATALAAIGTFTREMKPHGESQDDLLLQAARLGKVAAINRIIEQLNRGVSL